MGLIGGLIIEILPTTNWAASKETVPSYLSTHTSDLLNSTDISV